MDWPKRRVYYTNNKKEFNSPKKTYLYDVIVLHIKNLQRGSDDSREFIHYILIYIIEVFFANLE